MVTFPPVLWLLVRSPNTALLLSLVLYLATRAFGWNLPGYPGGRWYFNPFAWQFLFVIGAWVAVGGARGIQGLLQSRPVLWAVALFLLFSLVMTLAARFGMDSAMPESLWSVFIPNDKTNLAPYRIIHFLALALVVSRLVPCNAPSLRFPVWQPALISGQRSLEVFCAGIFLAFVARFLIELVSNSLAFQVVVSIAGIMAMVAVAYLRTWSREVTSPRAVG